MRTNNLVGELAEFLVSAVLGLKRSDPSKKNYDAIEAEGGKEIRYQIKARWQTDEKDNSQLELGAIEWEKENGERPFEYLVAVLFNKNFVVKKAYKISFEKIESDIALKRKSNTAEATWLKKKDKYALRMDNKAESLICEDLTISLKKAIE